MGGTPFPIVNVMAEQVNVLLVREKEKIRETKLALAIAGCYDPTRRIARTEGGCFALPITPSAVDKLVAGKDDGNGDEFASPTPSNPNMGGLLAHFNRSCYVLARADMQPSKKGTKTDSKSLKSSIIGILNRLQPPLSEEKCTKLLTVVPLSWQRHGNLVVLPLRAFDSVEWRQIISQSSDFWDTVATALRCTRLARNSEIAPDKYRSSCAMMLKGTDPWVQHVDNGIKYVFDVTHVMFSAGNIAEKLRVARFDCRGETVVDLYAGIGYFTLPYLIHACAETVHACEWNERAVEGLRRGLVANRVDEERCTVHVGDCRIVCPRGVADRVNLGLIPSSESGWQTACAALRPNRGGWLHIHGNVAWRDGEGVAVSARNPWEEGEGRGEAGGEGKKREERGEMGEERGMGEAGGEGKWGGQVGVEMSPRRRAKENWVAYIVKKIGPMISEGNPLSEGWRWDVRVGRVGTVKSYAPCVDHMVADVECRPVPV